MMTSDNQSPFKCRMCGACCRIKDGIVRVSDAEIAAVLDVILRRSPKFLGPREPLPEKKEAK